MPPGKARADCSEAIRRAPKLAILWSNRGGLLAHMGRAEEGIQDFEHALALDSSLTNVWWNLADAMAIQGRLAAAIGDPQHYRHAKQVFRRSGLVSGRNDSGVRQKQGKGNKVLKTGDVHLRRALLDAIHTFILHQPVLFSYYAKLKLTKPDLVARVATARRANGILWATLRDQHSTTLLYKPGVQM